MASLAQINIRFRADLSEFSTGMQTALRDIDKAGQQFQKIGRSMSAFVTLPLLAAGGAAVKFASDYNESLNKVDVSFKSSSVQVKEFAKTSLESFGIASGTALDLAATYGDMATGMGLTTGEAAKMSTSLVGLAGDLASFKNISIDIANTALTSIFSGETESLKKLGIIMTEVNLKQFALNSGIKKTYETMSQAEKVQLRYNYVLSVTKNSQGDFARTQGGASNQMRIFTESLKQIGQQLGMVILPLFTKVITVINEKIKAFGRLSEGTKTVIVVVAGLVAVIGPLLLGIGAILSVVPLVVAGFTAVSGVIVSLISGFVLLSGAILPVVGTVAFLYGAFVVLGGNAKKAAGQTAELSDATKELNLVIAQGTKNAAEEVGMLDKLYSSATNVKASTEERTNAINQLQELFPAYFKNIDDEAIKNGTAKRSYDELRDAIFNKARASAIDNELQNRANERIAKEVELRDKIIAARKRVIDLEKNGAKSESSVTTSSSGVDIVSFKSEKDIIKEANESLGNYKTQLNEFYNNARAQDQSLYLAKKQYSEKSIGLIENEAQVRKADAAAAKASADALALEGSKKGEKIFDNGTVAFYEKQIALLKTQQSEVAKTGVQYYLLGNEIAAVEEKINKIALDRIEPMDLKAIVPVEQLVVAVQTTEQMMARLAASVSGAKAVIAAEMVDISAVIGEAVTALANNAAVGFGEAIGSLVAGTSNMGNVISGMIGMIANFMGDLGKQLIALGIAKIAFDKIAVSGIGAVIAGTALVALSTIFKSTLNKGPKTQAFANGGIVGGSSYYGDKIMARVNSAEMVSNTDQQKKIWNGMNSGGGDSGGFVASTVIKGSDMLVVIERATARKNRTS